MLFWLFVESVKGQNKDIGAAFQSLRLRLLEVLLEF